jgi:hypothetical protein
MAGKDFLPIQREFNWELGPNYTDPAISLEEGELAECDNMYWEGKLKTIPGGAAMNTTAISGSPRVTGMFLFKTTAGVKSLICASSGGRVDKLTSTGNFTSVTSGLSTVADTYWQFVAFNNVMIGTSGNNAPQQWNGTTWAALAGGPPQGKYISSHVDYVLIGNMGGTQIGAVRYSDTTDHETWPAANLIKPGVDDLQELTGLQRYGDVTFMFKERSIYILSGSDPNTWSVERSMSDLGCIAPQTITWTDLGIFFWSEGGPAMFNGYRSYLMTKRLRGLMDDVDWSKTARFTAGYDPYLKQVLCSYVSTASGDGYPDKTLLIDLWRLQQAKDREKLEYAIWPITKGVTALASGLGFRGGEGNPRLYMGFSNGNVGRWNNGTDWNSATIVPRARTRVLNLGDPTKVIGVRFVDVWTEAGNGKLVLRYAVDSATSYTTHTGANAVSLANAGKDLKMTRAEGDGAGNYIHGRIAQFEITHSGSTGITLVGLEMGFEPSSASRRSTQLV